MELNCIIVDDEPLARDLLKGYVQKVPELLLHGEYENALAAKSALGENKIDILFLDIEMPDLSGLEFIRSIKNRPATIVTTAYSEFAIESFELEVVDYLLKPVTFNRFYKAVLRVFDLKKLKQPTPVRSSENPRDHIFIKSGNKIVQLECKQIRYVEGMSEYVKVFTTDKTVISLQSLTKLMEFLPRDTFVRIHRSHIINLNEVKEIEGNRAHLKDGTALVISKGRKEELLAAVRERGLIN